MNKAAAIIYIITILAAPMVYSNPPAESKSVKSEKIAESPSREKIKPPEKTKVSSSSALVKTLQKPPVKKSKGSAGSENITVTGKIRRSKPVSADTLEVKGRKLREKPSATFVEALASESADIHVTSRGTGIHGVASGSTGGIYIRGLGGFPNSQILMVEDGVPDYQGIFGHPIPDAYSSHLIDSVTIIKGGDSVLYGTNAMGGVIVIKSRWLKVPGLELIADVQSGTFETIGYNLSGLLRRGPWNFAVFASQLETQGHRPGSGGSRLILGFAARRCLGDHAELMLRTKAVHIDGADPGPVTHPTPGNWFDVWRFSASFGPVFHFSKGNVQLVTWINTGIHKLYDGFHSVDTLAGITGKIEYNLSSKLLFTGGATGEFVDGFVENLIDGEKSYPPSAFTPSVFGQFNYKPLKKLELTTGGRFLLDETEGGVFLYKAAAGFRLNRNFRFRGGITRNFRQPTIRELYLPWPVANPDLKPEFSLNSSLGIHFESTHVDSHITAFRTSARNLIRYFGSWPTAEVVNIDSYEVNGIEGALKLKDLGPFSPFIMASVQDVGRYTKQNPDQKFIFGVDFKMPLKSMTILSTLSGQYVRGLYMNNYSRDPMNDVFFLDFTLRLRLKKRAGYRIEPYLNVRNITDNRYAWVLNYTMPGINILAGLKMELK